MTVILLRHARSTSNTAGVLAGRSGVDLDEKGREQATGLIDRIGDLPIRAVASSPMLRCQRTVEPLAEALCLEPLIDDRFSEVDYGEWTGRKIGDLVDEPLWRVVQAHPSAAVFPGGEGLAQVQTRAVAAVREHDRRLACRRLPGSPMLLAARLPRRWPGESPQPKSARCADARNRCWTNR